MSYYKKTALTQIDKYTPGMEDGINEDGIPYLKTLEGNLKIPPGGYVATGIEGERWAIQPEIFKKTYAPWTKGALKLMGCLENSEAHRSGYMTPCKYCIFSRLDNECLNKQNKNLFRVYS